MSTVIKADPEHFKELYYSKEFLVYCTDLHKKQGIGYLPACITTGVNFGCWMMTAQILPDATITLLDAFRIFTKVVPV